MAGVARYQQHPYQRQLKDPPVIWQEGSTRLLDYGGKGQPVLFIPSLINKAYILDLDKQRSLLRWLTHNGMRPLLLDWGFPGELERDFNLERYLARAAAALFHVKQSVRLVGYCMGGLLALRLAQLHPDRIEKIALLATPWDFHAGDKMAALRSAALFRLWQPGCQWLGELPVDYIQTLFTLLDPLGPQQKFLRFAELTDEDEVESFVALEDWLNDGVPLTTPVAQECLINWYERNDANSFVQPERIKAPALVMIPAQDKIVPPESAEALATKMPDCRRIKVPLGHIGMIVSRHAQNEVWKPLAQWLRAV
jgi:polyhydroxyalkanoate synthase